MGYTLFGMALSTCQPRDTEAPSKQPSNYFRYASVCMCAGGLTIQLGDTCMTYRLPADADSGCHDALLPTDALLINFTSSGAPRPRGKRGERERERKRERGRDRGPFGLGPEFSRTGETQPCLDLRGR